jgi:hypothetical protein
MARVSKAEEKKIATDPFAVHEVLHTAHVLSDTFERHIVDHPVVKHRPELKDKADKALEAMLEVYQEVGGL